jgi:hypothetical protein
MIVFDHSLVVPNLFHNEGYSLNFRSSGIVVVVILALHK